MKFYFYSPVPAKAAHGGKLIGDVGKNVVYTAAKKDDVFDIYLSGCAPATVSYGFSLNADMFAFYGGRLFVPHVKRLDRPYAFLSEKRVIIGGNEVIARLFCDGQTKLTVTSPYGSDTATLSVDAKDISIFNCGNAALVEAGKTVKQIVVFSLVSNRIILSEVCVRYRIKDGLSVDKLVFCGTLCHLEKHYSITDAASLVGASLVCPKDYRPIGPLSAGYHFLHLVKYGGSYESYLSPSLMKKTDVIKSFLGDFDFVLPPVEKEFPKTFSIVGGAGVKYVDFCFDKDKIIDISVESKK